MVFMIDLTVSLRTGWHRATRFLGPVLAASLTVFPATADAAWTLLLVPPRASAPPANAPAEAVEKYRASPFDAKASWDKWTPVAVYVSAEECEKGRKERVARITERAKGADDGKKPSPERVARAMAAYDLARCVSIHEKGLP